MFKLSLIWRCLQILCCGSYRVGKLKLKFQNVIEKLCSIPIHCLENLKFRFTHGVHNWDKLITGGFCPVFSGLILPSETWSNWIKRTSFILTLSHYVYSRPIKVYLVQQLSPWNQLQVFKIKRYVSIILTQQGSSPTPLLHINVLLNPPCSVPPPPSPSLTISLHH